MLVYYFDAFGRFGRRICQLQVKYLTLTMVDTCECIMIKFHGLKERWAHLLFFYFKKLVTFIPSSFKSEGRLLNLPFSTIHEYL